MTVSAPYSDLGVEDTHKATVDWGDGTTTTSVSGGIASATHSYISAGVYTVKMTVEDDDSGVSNQSILEQYVVIYDPAAGFVTGGGWINSPAGAYAPDPTMTGKANFGFVSKYQKGANVPTGNTEFQFHAGNLNFKSTQYEWLVVQGSSGKASYKGTGTVNGAGQYGFMLTVYDGGNSNEKFRIKIWNKATGDEVLYDNQMGAADDADASLVIAGGSIVIHAK
jgi:PKD repeat protein